MRGRLAALACVLLVSSFVLDLLLRVGGVELTRALDDVVELLAAAFGAAAALWRARQASRRFRTSWTLLGLGCGAWAAGEALWCYYELLAGHSDPFPSPADLG